MKYLLDTDTISYALRGQGDVGAQMVYHKPSQIAVSAISVAELRFGADRKKSSRLHALIDAFVGPLRVIPFDHEAATVFGRIGTLLADRGTPIGDFDVLIAAHAIALKRVLVTNNSRHFNRVPGLSTENWFQPS